MIFLKKKWEIAEGWLRDSVIKSVKFFIENPDALNSAQHDAWCNDKLKDGWIYGSVKDGINKTHPCLVPFEHLPIEQQAKDALFRAVCNSLVKLL